MIRYLFIGIILISSLKGASQKLVLKPELDHVNRSITVQHGAIKATFVDNMAFGPVHKEGIKILLVGADLVRAIEGMVVDFRTTPEGTGFAIYRLRSNT